MPSGGGFSGGGGGGFSGGGFSGGYHGGRYGGRGGGGGGLVTCVVMSILAIIVIIIVLPITQTGRNRNSVPTDYFSPGDSRLVSFSSFFCDGINLKAGESGTGTSASIATVNTLPSLTDRNNFTITDQRSLASRQFRFYQYFLYPNSNISISPCSSSRPLDVYLIKGNRNAERWQESPSSRNTEIFRTVLCEPGQSIPYNVTEQDEYYVFFHNPGRDVVTFSYTIQYERFEYTFPSENASLEICSVSPGSSCTVGIPYGSTGSQQALVVTSIPQFVNWGENVDVSVGCNHRGWAVAIVILIPMIVFLVVLGGAIGGILLYFLYCKD